MYTRNEHPLKESYTKINQLKYYIFYATTLEEINYYCDLLKKEIIRLDGMNKLIRNQPSIYSKNNLKEFTLNELKQYDGTDGKKAYVAVNGIVYDVSSEPTWGGATHFKLLAGNDLTSEFIGCHGDAQLLQELPKVGVLKTNNSN